jgi:hypothetical protein
MILMVHSCMLCNELVFNTEVGRFVCKARCALHRHLNPLDGQVISSQSLQTKIWIGCGRSITLQIRVDACRPCLFRPSLFALRRPGLWKCSISDWLRPNFSEIKPGLGTSLERACRQNLTRHEGSGDFCVRLGPEDTCA